MTTSSASPDTITPTCDETVAQLARRYSVSVRTIHEWKNRGWIPYRKIGKCLRFHVADVEAAMRERFEVRAKTNKK